MQQQQTLDGMSDTARLEFEVLLGPAAELMHIRVKVEDPSGRLLAMRSWPCTEKVPAGAALDIAWRTFLGALPHETFTRKDGGHPAQHRQNSDR